ncbi:hypothetical protein VXQ18_00485 [Brucella abortus]|nr:hypothetical protein [Brucella abortus]
MLTARRLMRHRSFRIGLVLLLIVVHSSAFSPLDNQWQAQRDIPCGCEFQPPGLEHLFGTDNLGRDLWTRVLYGAQVSSVGSG